MNISSIKTNNTDSPKTPGGISKSLLTPCRRVGLSRKWRKGGVSPFISPLSSASSNKEDKQDTPIRKKKKCNAEVDEKTIQEEDSCGEIIPDICNTPTSTIDIDRTPTRTLLPRKKSKILITAQNCQEEVKVTPQSISELNNKIVYSSDHNLTQDTIIHSNKISNPPSGHDNIQQYVKQGAKVSKLSRNNSESSNKLIILKSSVKNAEASNSHTICSNNNTNSESRKTEIKLQNRQKSPNNLSKECMVVLQKKIFKIFKNSDNDIVFTENINESVPTKKSVSQALFDSDSDDVPLSVFNKTDSVQINTENQKESNDYAEKTTQNILNLTNEELDKDFIEKKRVDVKKVERTTSTTGLKNKPEKKKKFNKLQNKSVPKTSSQSSNSFDDDDDFDYSKTKTILIKRSYDKVTKPLKAKSTGSITQKDIDDIKARIESKKNILLAKAITSETKELRDLIKKWQLGCQTALIELLDLMKKKLPEQKMEHSELLQMLKIPPHLVGYDSDNECYNTPDDTTIILSALKLN